MTQTDLDRRYNSESNFPVRESGEPGASNKSIVLILWRGAWIIVGMAVVCVASAFFYLSKATPIYSSSARMLVEQQGPAIMNEAVNAGGQSSNYLATQCELIKSTPILGPVGDLPEIRQMKTFAGLDNPVGALKASLTTEITKPDELLNISFESPYPDDASDVVNAVIDSYRKYYAERKRSTAVEVLRILEKEKKDRDAELQRKVNDILDFKQKNPNLSYISEKGNIIVDQLAKLAEALTGAHLDSLEARGLFEGAKAMAGDSARMEQWTRLQRGAGSATPQENEIQQLEAQCAEMLVTMGSENVKIKQLEARIRGLKSNIDERSPQTFEGYLAALEQRWLTSKQREEELQKSFDEQQTKALSLNSESAKMEAMASEQKRLERLCDMLDNRIKELKVTEDVGAMNVSVLEYAKPAATPIRPKRSTVLFEALVLGLMLGGGLAYLRDWLDHRLNSPEEIREMLGLNVLGVLPNMPGKEPVSSRGQKVHMDPMSEVAEAYRTIRTAIYFGAPDGKAKTVLVTSPAPGDGKSTTASNLAIAMAQAGQRVLLLDADFRRPTIYKVFSIEEGAPGITDVLADQTPLAGALKTTCTPGLFVLTCGALPKNPSEILNGRAFGASSRSWRRNSTISSSILRRCCRSPTPESLAPCAT